jgi:alcohol dehydrogenase (cytochrome c)
MIGSVQSSTFLLWAFLASTTLAAAAPVAAAKQESAAPGLALFESRCSQCHGADGGGGEFAPGIAGRVPNLSDDRIRDTVMGGLPARGMPAIHLSETEMPELIAFLRTLKPGRTAFEPYRLSVRLPNRGMLEGMVLGEGAEDLQLRGDDGQVHVLRRAGTDEFREVTSGPDWSTYNGDPGGNRYTTLERITPSNVRHLAPRWIFNMPNAARLEVTPVVSGGIMYVTNGNECFALDAGSGRQIWHFQRARTAGLLGNAASGINRGVALSGGRLFMVTDDAHLLALDRGDGKVLWDTPMADWHENYNATSAPLVVGHLVITGSAGGEEGARGFLAAFDQSTGKEVWRFWTVPSSGERAAATWQGGGIEHGGAVAWFTGVYDAETDTLFWPTGNPGNDYNGDDRRGDDLYADCILALDPRSGKLKWHYQTTPHDVWDWDASETPLVIDASWRGSARKLLVQGNRNGFFYVWDRVSGKLLLARQFVHELSWARGIGADGRPIEVPGQEPSQSGTRVCPSQGGATNWYSPSYSPVTGLFYMQTNERCSIYVKRSTDFEYGRPFLGGTPRNDVNPKPVRILRAVDLRTGDVRWETPQVGSANTSGGTLATSTGLVFFGDDSGAFAAADAASGRVLWRFDAGANWRASPMAYQFDGREFIAVAAAGSILAFGLTE